MWAPAYHPSGAQADDYRVKGYEIQIDQLVYRLYDLTPEEIGVVEGEHVCA